jgi:hypothetical protein
MKKNKIQSFTGTKGPCDISFSESDTQDRNILLLYYLLNNNQKTEETELPKEVEIQQVPRNALEDAGIRKPRFQPLCLGKAIAKGESNLLYGHGGCGKTPLSYLVGMNEEIHYPIYINIDSDSDETDPIYKKVLGGKGELINIKTFDEEYSKLETEIKPEANRLTFLHYNAAYHRFEEIKEKVYKQMGIRHCGPKKIDNIGVVEELVREGVEQRGADLLVIDSFNALFGDPRTVKRADVQRITGLAAKFGLTVLVIHHENKSRQMTGPETIRDCFYAVYRLNEELGITAVKDNEEILRLDTEKVKGAKKKSYRIKRTFLDDVTIAYEVLSESNFLGVSVSKVTGPSLNERIQQVLTEYGNACITFDDLMALLGGNPPPTKGSVKNCLKDLSDRSIVRMSNKTWKKIIIAGR